MKLRSSLSSITPYVPGKLKEGAIKLASNENPLGPSPAALDRIREVAGQVSLYPDADCVALKGALSRALGVQSQQLIVGNGSDEVLVFIAGAYMEPGLNAVTSQCTFSEYTFAVKLFGGEMRYAPMQKGTFDLPALLALIDENTRIVFLCNPNNPTGTYYDKKAFEAFMAKVPSSVLVVSDEAYFEYVEVSDYPDSVSLLSRYENLIVLRTFSKLYGLAGMRVGYGISSAKVISDLLKTKEPFNVNLLAQEAACAAIADKEFPAKSRQVNREGRKWLEAEFEKMGLQFYTSQANFICVQVKRDCIEVFQQLMERGVTIRPMKGFGLPDWIRVTIGTSEQNRYFIDALQAVLAG